MMFEWTKLDRSGAYIQDFVGFYLSPTSRPRGESQKGKLGQMDGVSKMQVFDAGEWDSLSIWNMFMQEYSLKNIYMYFFF